MDLLAPIVAAVLVVVAVTATAPRLGLPGPLLLVVVGIGVGLLPIVPDVVVEPAVVLELVLPPLLYSSAVTMPSMDFRRDLRFISGLSVLLVGVSALVVGLVLMALVPGVGLATGIAIGAIVSPTDAVATSIGRRAGLSPRVATVLEGEAMLNDASALVLLRSAVAATAAAVSLGGVVADFVWAVLAAAVIGWVVGRLNRLVRSHLTQPAASVAVSVVAPFVAYLPTEQLGASGLVAAVTAGLVTGYGSARDLSAQDRLAEAAVWRTVELVLEGGVFLLMGLQASGLLHQVQLDHSSRGLALGLGLTVAALVVLVRGAFIAPGLWLLDHRRRRRDGERRERLALMQRRLDDPGTRRPGRMAPEQATAWGERVRRMIAREEADLDYLADQRLGPREGVVLVWAGMRGAVTVAAAQSLPSSTPHRSLLVLVAFVVAAGSLLVQGSTLPTVVRRLGLDTTPDDSADRADLHARLTAAAEARLAAEDLVRPDGTPFSPGLVERLRDEIRPQLRRVLEPAEGGGATADELRDLRRVLIEAQRAELVRQRRVGAHSSAVLDEALDQLDADQLGLDLR
ncbi:MAG: sodium:proton antiporter [Actinobacteria bacterium]|nr:sodium:proton antiporter [Actinomycetota bacterium]